MKRSALISPDGLYRYWLVRDWTDEMSFIKMTLSSLGRVLYVMLNPSTADENIDDPTIRRCIGYARAWSYSSLEVVNPFAFRATKPSALISAVDPIGPDNDKHIAAAVGRAQLVVAAWGARGVSPHLRARVKDVQRMFDQLDVRVMRFDTKNPEPPHPLYLPTRTGLRQIETW